MYATIRVYIQCNLSLIQPFYNHHKSSEFTTILYRSKSDTTCTTEGRILPTLGSKLSDLTLHYNECLTLFINRTGTDSPTFPRHLYQETKLFEINEDEPYSWAYTCGIAGVRIAKTSNVYRCLQMEIYRTKCKTHTIKAFGCLKRCIVGRVVIQLCAFVASFSHTRLKYCHQTGSIGHLTREFRIAQPRRRSLADIF